jgi:hypothetical protein
MNSENLDTRITENGALDRNIWAFKVFRDKMVISRASRVILEFLEWLEGFGAKE